MLRPLPPHHPRPVRNPFPRGLTRTVLAVFLVNCMTAAWMFGVGDWLDRQPGLLGMVTWNGHHRLIAVLAVVTLLVLGPLAALTQGFTRGSETERTMIIVVCFASLVNLAGLLAVVLPIGVGVLALGVSVRLLGLAGRRGRR